MKYLVLTLLMFATITTAKAHEVGPKNLDIFASYDYYKTPNGGNNYDDGQGFSLGISHDITERIGGRAYFSHITDVHFPVSDDPKGSFGELRGNSVNYDVILSLPTNRHFDVYLTAGAGYLFPDFKENPFLQDNNVTVNLEEDIILRAGGGVSYKVNDWDLFAEILWSDTDIEKDARDNTGREWNILGDEVIGLEFIQIKIGAKYKW